MAKNSVTLHRVLTAPPEKVFRVFSNPDFFASWLPPYGFTCKVHQMDFQTGGTYKILLNHVLAGEIFFLHRRFNFTGIFYPRPCLLLPLC